jgi:hypothetical protein
MRGQHREIGLQSRCPKTVAASQRRRAEFAMAYADQTEHDWRALLDAIEAGRISAEEPPST